LPGRNRVHLSGRDGRYAESRCALRVFVLATMTWALALCGCGYHVAGRGSNLPAEWTSIAVPMFKNDTVQYRIEQRFTQAVIREFNTRTKYHMVSDPESADAVLHGEILSIETSPVLFDANTGQVTTMLVTLHAKVSLVSAGAKKPVYENDDMVFRNEYKIPSNVTAFFQEEDPALERMARDFASNLVANVLEGF
jgi:outer membrane lipopolysaccharide assembly protein LptE/RlpB